MSSGGKSESKQWSEPWKAQQGSLKNLYARAEGLFNQGPYQYYPGQTVEGFDPSSENAFRMVEQRAANGDPTLNAARGETERTIRGDYLSPDSNPHLKSMYDIVISIIIIKHIWKKIVYKFVHKHQSYIFINIRKLNDSQLLEVC